MRIYSGDIYLNGKHHTAVALDDSGIIALDDAALALGDSEDLGEKFLTHAFMDGHAHPLFAGREHLGPLVTNAKSVAEIQEIVRDWVTTNPTPHWAVGGAYDRSIVEGGRFLASWLDEVAPDRPVVLHASDHHTLWANSAAMRAAGVINSAPAVSDGSIDTDPSGRPTGVFRETEAKELITNCVPNLDIEDELRALVWSHRELAKLGIAAVQDAWMDRGMVEVYLEAAKRDLLVVRTNLAFWAQPGQWREASKLFAKQRSEVRALDHSKLTAETVKFFADGVFGSATASVKEPYESASGNFGKPVWSRSELFAAVKHFASQGYQIHIHGIGDAGVATALDAIENAGTPPKSVIAHTELVDPTDIPRFAELGVIANFEPLWAREDGMLTSCIHHLGRARIDSMYRMRDFVSAGATVTFGSDWPVSSPDPILGLFTAVHRALPERPEAAWTPQQALSVPESLTAYTTAVAGQLSLDPNAADLIILSGSPFENPILDLCIVETIIGGQTEFTRQ